MTSDPKGKEGKQVDGSLIASNQQQEDQVINDVSSPSRKMDPKSEAQRSRKSIIGRTMEESASIQNSSNKLGELNSRNIVFTDQKRQTNGQLLRDISFKEGHDQLRKQETSPKLTATEGK
jgi:hypothetical protein